MSQPRKTRKRDKRPQAPTLPHSWAHSITSRWCFSKSHCPQPRPRRWREAQFHRQQKDGQPLPHLLGLTPPSQQLSPSSQIAGDKVGLHPVPEMSLTWRQALELLSPSFQSPMWEQSHSSHLWGQLFCSCGRTTQPPHVHLRSATQIRGRLLVQGGCHAVHHWCFRKHSVWTHATHTTVNIHIQCRPSGSLLQRDSRSSMTFAGVTWG